MVVRPPIEKWNRSELEENYHAVLDQTKNYQKKVTELEKKITQMNSKFRRAVMDRQPKEGDPVERDKYDQLVSENQLLSMKLKAVKHQLLTYTTPTARGATALAMTGRSTFRPPSTVRRQPPSSVSVDEMQSGRRQTTRSNRQRNEENVPSRPHAQGASVRIVEGSHSEKAMVIRLNRQMREKNVQISSLQYELEKAKSELAMVRDEYERRNQEYSDLLEKKTESGEVKSSWLEGEVLRRDLLQAKEELSLLAAANERLVKQTLAHEMDGNETEIVDLKRKVVELETNLKEMEKKNREADRKLRQERRQLHGWKEKERQRVPPNKTHPVREPSEEDEYKPKQKRNREVDDVLNKLYKDVNSILESHETRCIDDGISLELSETQKLTRWQKMYAELYDEMEKVRNMLLLQHNINQKQTAEISLLHEECERLKVSGEKKLTELKRKLEEKQKQIDVQQQQIHEIAYSGQKPLIEKQPSENVGITTRLSLKMTGIKFVNARGAASVFLSLEFFDFELQTTPVLRAVDQNLDYTTEYNVVVSNLLIHYLQTNGISIELYRAKSTSYEFLGAGTVSLDELLGRRQNTLIGGDLPLRDIETSHVLAIISYELTTTSELSQVLGAYRRAETAQKMIPLERKNLEPGWNELSVSTRRCTGLENLSSEPMEVCLVYELLAFSPYATDNVIGTGSVNFKSEKKWVLPHEALQYFNDQEISFYLMDRGEKRTEEGVLGMLSLSLAPLLDNRTIKGSFPMIKADGSDLGVFLEVETKWTGDLPKIEAAVQEKPSRPEPVYLPPSPSTPPTPISLPKPQDHEVDVVEESVEHFSEEEVKSAQSSERDDTEDTVREVEKDPSWMLPYGEKRRSMSEDSGDTFTKDVREATLEDEGEEEEEKLEETPSYLSDLSDLPPVARPRISKNHVSLESEEDTRDHVVGFRSPLHQSIPPSDTSSVSSPRREKPPVALPIEGGRRVIKLSERLEEHPDDEHVEVIVTISIFAVRNTAYSPLMERRFEGVNFFIDWKFLDFPDEDCKVLNSQPIPVIWNEPIIFDFTKEYQLSRRKVALLEQYIESQNHMEFCLVSDAGIESEELAVASLELMRIPPEDPILVPMLDVNGVRWADLEISLAYSPNIFDHNEQ